MHMHYLIGVRCKRIDYSGREVTEWLKEVELLEHSVLLEANFPFNLRIKS
jgi:hypothetical protein